MKKFSNVMFVFCFVFILFMVPIATKNKLKPVFSVYENRSYEKAPIFTKENLFNATYFSQWDKYFSDHVIGRNSILRASVNIDMNILHKKVVNNVVIQEDLLLPYNVTNVFDRVAVKDGIEGMAKELAELDQYIKDRNGKFYYIGIPEQYSALRDLYPDYLPNHDEKLTYIEENFFGALSEKGVDYVNMHDVLASDGNIASNYSKIDHHYNFFGAFSTYQNTIKKINATTNYNLQVLENEDMNFEHLNMKFLGSRNRKLYNYYENDEKLVVAYPKNSVEFVRKDNNVTVDSKVFNTPPVDSEFVEYTAYMGGDVAETVIDTNRPELPTLLIFGDSFTNALETVAYYNFDKMYALDLRYYNDKTLYEYLDIVKPDIVIGIRDDTCYISTDGNGKFR